ncbi:hypothetical protein BSLA_01r4443 [Burkholderia stabilis]|nr:hypothetical protein BSLA_01r4443 [Burkholderia stabilis]
MGRRGCDGVHGRRWRKDGQCRAAKALPRAAGGAIIRQPTCAARKACMSTATRNGVGATTGPAERRTRTLADRNAWDQAGAGTPA